MIFLFLNYFSDTEKKFAVKHKLTHDHRKKDPELSVFERVNKIYLSTPSAKC